MPQKDRIRKLFNGIAPEYDRLNHILSLGIDRIWRKAAVKEAVGRTDRPAILDVATGTGDFAIELAKGSRDGIVTGIDISEEMLAIGTRKVLHKKLSSRIRLQNADCEDLPFGDGSFDRVTAAFGVRNFENLHKGLAEMARVTRPGGKIVILELSIPDNRMLAWLYCLYFRKVLPAIGGFVSGDRKAYEYLPASVLNFPKAGKFCRMLEECGFTDVKSRALTSGICRMYTGTR